MINVIAPLPQPVFAQSIEELKEELKELEEERQNINSDASNAEEKIKENEARQKTVKAKIADLDKDLAVTADKLQIKQGEISVTENDISSTQTKITTTENDIKQTEEEIVQLNDEIEDLMERIDQRQELISSRLRSMQRTGGKSSYLELVFSAQNFSDFISRLTAVSKILDSDKNIMEIQKEDKLSLETKRVEVETKKESLETKRNELTAAKNKLESKKATLVAQKQELADIEKELNIQRSDQSNLMANLEDEHTQLEHYQMSLQEQRETLAGQQAAKKKLLEMKLEQLANEDKNDNEGNNDNSTSPPVSGGGGFMFPSADGYINSEYGARWGSFHHGIDIASGAASSGSDISIYAAADGVVSRAYRSSSYGNTVFITHDINGQTYTTVYAHMKYFPSVSNYQFVKKGQKIGVMGNTGDVRPGPSPSRPYAGTHLHFELHKGDWNYSKSNSVNPRGYLN